MGVEPILATAYSLFIVGATALLGGIQSARQGMVDFKTVMIFGVPSIAAVYATRAFIVPIIPDHVFSVGSFEVTKPILLMVLFAIVMVAASITMIKPSKKGDGNASENTLMTYNYPMILLEGSVVGVLTGLVGAGGGFLIIPALVLLAKMPMKLAVGTSLFIIAAKSLIGFTGDRLDVVRILYCCSNCWDFYRDTFVKKDPGCETENRIWMVRSCNGDLYHCKGDLYVN
jgi:uncharacterized membrane protein YfcA